MFGQCIPWNLFFPFFSCLRENSKIQKSLTKCYNMHRYFLYQYNLVVYNILYNKSDNIPIYFYHFYNQILWSAKLSFYNLVCQYWIAWQKFTILLIKIRNKICNLLSYLRKNLNSQPKSIQNGFLSKIQFSERTLKDIFSGLACILLM